MANRTNGTARVAYHARSNAGGRDVTKAKKYGRELERLEKKHEGITAELLVNEARRPTSLFHDEFEWSNAKAAQKHRLHQARQLIQWVEITLEVIPSSAKTRKVAVEPASARAFHFVRDSEHGGRYVHLRTVQGDEGMRQQLLDECMRAGARWAAKAKMFDELKRCAIAVEVAVKKARRQAG